MKTKTNMAADAVERNAAGKAGDHTAAAVSDRNQEVAGRNGKPGNRMYLGPSIPGAVRHGTVFQDGVLPEKAKECVRQLPVMERLFVGAEGMPEAVRELRRDQSMLRAVYARVEAYFHALAPGAGNNSKEG